MRIGIITMFYNSSNYGGILQAYALVKVLTKNNIKVEQICYDQLSAYTRIKRVMIKLHSFILFIQNLKNRKLYFLIRKRSKNTVKAALSLIPHSKSVYTEKTIKNSIYEYTAFITGSDQVWHGEWPAYFLTFVPSGIKKIAYAASMGKTHLTEAEIKKIRTYINSFTGVSVREADTAKILQTAIPEKKIEIVLDPTLLLEKEDWDAVVSDRIIAERYLFCYFLGNDAKMRKVAVDYAKKHNLLLLTIPHMKGYIENNDIGFGDQQSFDATPQDFLSYIKYAEVVFTDSFHASVFSQIFHKQYFVFGRTEHKEMNNRIVTLTELFHTTDHFICDNEHYDVEYIDRIKDINYSNPRMELERLKNESKEFLKEHVTV